MAKRTTVAKWLPKYDRWQIKVRKDGERKTFTCPIPGREGQRECHRKADAWLDDGLIDQNIKVSLLFDKYIEQLKIDTGTSHWSSYESLGRLYIKPCIGNKKVSALTEQNLQDVISYMREHAEKKPLSQKYYKNMIGCLKNFIKFARKNKVCKLYIEKLNIPHDAKESEKLPLVPDDLVKLFSSSKTSYRSKEVDEWFIYAWRFAVITGLRPGEICGLQKADIQSSVCSIRRAINVHNETTHGKNRNAKRTFVIPPSAAAVLKDQQKMLREVGVISPYIFPTVDGEPFKEKAYYDCWKRYCKYNGISPRTPYEMRHTFFSATKKLPEELVKAMGGHGKDFDTFAWYGHEMPGEAEETAALVEAVFVSLIKRG